MARSEESSAAEEDAEARLNRWSHQMEPLQDLSRPLFPLDRVRIENVRAVGDLTLALHPRMTVIFGKNASGKSTILDALAVGLAAIADRMPRTDGQREEDLPQFSQRDLRLIGKKGTPAAYLRTTLFGQPRDSRAEPLHWSVETRYASRGPQSADREAPELQPYLDRLNEALRNDDASVAMPVFVHYGVDRAVSKQAQEDAGPGSLRENHRRRESGLDGALVGAARFDRAVTAFRVLEDIELRRKPSRTAGPGMTDAKAELPALREVRQALELALQAPGGWRCVRPRIDAEASKFLVDFVHQDGRELKLQMGQLSDGFRTHLALVMDLALRMVQCNPPKEDGPRDGSGIRSDAIALIDEVDLHLHPQWQRHVLHGLLDAFPRTQFVVTTHSPQVLAGVQDGLVYKFTDDREGVRASVINSFGKDSNSTLVEDMDTSERPHEVQLWLDDIHRLLDEERFAEAEEAIERVQARLGHDDAALVALRTDLTFLRPGQGQDA